MVMHYQSYEPRRIIIRERHPPSAFYLVLSGSLIANVRETSPSTGKAFIRTVGDIAEGECFGEIALLERINRTASVVCKTRAELLVIYKEDFDQLILEPLTEQRRRDVEYGVKHVLFEEIDKSVFFRNPGEYFYQYFPKDSVVVKNSSTCPFLVLIKAGSCKLIGSYQNMSGDGHGKDFPAHMVDSFPLYSHMRKLGLARDPWERVPDPEADSSICPALEEGLLMGSIDKHTIRQAVDASSRPSTTWPSGRERPPAGPRQRSSTLSQALDQMEQQGRKYQRSLSSGGDESVGNFWSGRLAHSYREELPISRLRKLGKRPSQMWHIFQQEVPVYAEIATLTEGCVFGLETMVTVPGPSTTLVSEGAECLLVSKRLFLQHANIRSLRVAGDLVMAFPSSQTLEGKVKCNRKWERYKSNLVKSILGHHVAT